MSALLRTDGVTKAYGGVHALNGATIEVGEGTIAGLDAWRRMHETGEFPQEYLELDERAKRGWDTNEGDGPETSQT